MRKHTALLPGHGSHQPDDHCSLSRLSLMLATATPPAVQQETA